MTSNEDIIQSYNTWCKLNSVPIFATVSNHICSNRCLLWQYPTSPKKENIFVCKFARIVHYCGKRCVYAQETKNSESIVCGITGWVLPIAIEKNYVSITHDSCGNNMYTNNNQIIMGKKKNTSKRPKKACNVLSMPRIIECITAIFTVSAKQKTSQSKSTTFMKRCNAYIKSISKSNTISFLDAHRAFFLALPHPKNTLSKNNKISPIQLQKLASSILVYYGRLNLPVSTTHKTINTFTAVIVSKLRSGYTNNGIVIFPKVEWIAAMAPKDIQFAGIMGIQCRSMSIMWRKIQASIICSASGMPSHNKIFSLD